MKPLPLISKPLTAQQLRQRVVVQLAAHNGNGNGKPPAVKP